MNKWDTDKIIGTGLILALWLHMMIVCVVEITCGKTLPLDPASNIIACLAGYMGRSLAEKLKHPSPDEKT
ncbi:MAG: hypothetical protein IKE46_11840 [Selenomonadaceae bacterium]|nr:hypothetical protein [Selenomonadaceae bacterium]